MICPNCKTPIQNNKKVCTTCHRKNGSNYSSTILLILLAFFTFVALASISFILYFVSGERPNAQSLSKKSIETIDPLTSVITEGKLSETVKSIEDSEQDEKTKNTISDESTKYDELAFYQDYRKAYEEALNTSNFDMIENYFKYRSTAYFEIRDYMLDVVNKGFSFEFKDNHIVDSTILENKIVLETIEIFYFTNDQGVTTKYNRSKTYTIENNGFDDYAITNIENKNTEKN